MDPAGAVAPMKPPGDATGMGDARSVALAPAPCVGSPAPPMRPAGAVLLSSSDLREWRETTGGGAGGLASISLTRLSGRIERQR